MFTYIAQGLGWLLRTVYEALLHLGPEPKHFSYFAMSIILTTLLFKFLLLPLQLRSSRQMRKTQELQPQANEIRIKYKHDPQAAQMKIAQLYRENGASMTGGCLPLLAQLPIIWAFFRVMQQPQALAFPEPGLYEGMHKAFFWIQDLTHPDPYWYGLPLLVGLVTLLQSLSTPQISPDPNQPNPMRSMNYIMPVMLFWFALKYAGGLSLYWIVSTLFSAVQSLISNRKLLFPKKGE